MELFKIFGTLALTGVDKANEQLDSVTSKAQGSESKLSSACHKIGAALAGAFAADKVIEFGKSVVDTSAQSQSSFAKVTTLLDTSKVSTEDYYKSVKQGANESHESISDFSEALYQALSASVDQAHAVDFTTKAAKLAKAGFTDASTAVDVMTTAINAYGLSADDADHISDNLITTQNLGKTTVNELASSMGKVIPTASAYGVNIDNLCSSYAIMTKSGIATAESTTYLKSMMNELGKEGSNVSTILEAQTGKSFSECMQSGMSLGDVLQILYDSTGDNATAFANLWQSQEAGTGALALVNAGAQEFNSTLNQMTNDAGATQSAYEKIESTFSAKVEAMKAKFSNLKTEIGEKLLPVLGKVVDAVSGKVIPAIEKAGQWIDKHKSLLQGLAAAVAGAVAGYAALQAALGVVKLISFGQTLLTVITSIKSFAGAMSLVKMGLAAIGGPITVAVVAIGALVAAFIYLWNTSESFRNFWKTVWEGIKTVAKTAAGGIKTVIEKIGGFFGKIADKAGEAKTKVGEKFGEMKSAIESHGGGIKGAVSALGDHIKDSLEKGLTAAQGSSDNFWDNLRISYDEGGRGVAGVVEAGFDLQNQVVRGAFATLGSLFGVNLDGVADKVVTFNQGVRNKVVDGLNAVQDKVGDFFSKVGSKFESGWNAVVSTMESVWNGVTDFFGTIWDGIKDAFTTGVDAVGSFMSGAWDGITSTITTVWDGIVDVVTTVWDTIKNVVTVGIMLIEQIISAAVQILLIPWNFLWENFGTKIVAAWNAIKTAAETVWNAIKTVITTVWDAIKTGVTTAVNAVKTVVTTVWDAIKTGTTTAWNAIKTVVATVWNAIKAAVTTAANAVKTVVTTVWNAIKTATTTAWNAIKTVITTVWNGIKSVVTTVANAVKSAVTTAWNGIKSVTSTVFNAVKSTASTVWNGIKSTISNAVDGVKSKVTSGWNAVKSTTSTVWNGIKSAITTPINAAKDAVHNAIEKMKSFFHFSWSLPHLKLPHFSISGKFSLNPPSVPSFGISWYKKAMDNPYLFTKPTVFGMNPQTGQAKGAGEAGDEVMIGKNTMLNMISDAVSENNKTVIDQSKDQFDRLIDTLAKYLPAASDLQVVLDSGTLVGEITPAIDSELGKLSRARGRGLT